MFYRANLIKPATDRVSDELKKQGTMIYLRVLLSDQVSFKV